MAIKTDNPELNENFFKYFEIKYINFKFDYNKNNNVWTNITNAIICTEDHF